MHWLPFGNVVVPLAVEAGVHASISARRDQPSGDPPGFTDTAETDIGGNVTVRLTSLLPVIVTSGIHALVNP
jgi:hypothetical protein